MFTRTFSKTDDIESGSTEPLYPAMTESPDLRWSFIRKIYSIVAIQLILTVIVAAFVVSYHPIVTFLTTTRGGFACDILIIITPFIRKVILEAVILTAVVVVSLTLFTFWAAKKGYDFNFMGPFLFSALNVLICFSFIQICFPLDKMSVMIYAGVSAIVFCGYLVYDTDNLIKRYTDDEYIWAAVALYLDIINLFYKLLTILRAFAMVRRRT
ncbi:bax inhibitor 1-related protein [Artemisia annua]|uniref:Bax inhibitor 1-related protein n=1 Tax=Artemisia annua TaxID=35608 RepID=A0A2U1KR51_ARTAN|nr:bax inhibitor 1-related protein [Artemisia annua]